MIFCFRSMVLSEIRFAAGGAARNVVRPAPDVDREFGLCEMFPPVLFFREKARFLPLRPLWHGSCD